MIVQLTCWAVCAYAAAADASVVVVGTPPRPGKHRARDAAVAVVEDIENRVVQAGGNSNGVLVASLAWSTPDDLDLHVVVPSGSEISYRQRIVEGGELDVDMCVHGRGGGICVDRPVENVVFAEKAPQGRFKVYVQNFNYHLNTQPLSVQVARMQQGQKASKDEQALRLGKDRPVLFDLLVKVEGEYKLFVGLCTPAGKLHQASNVQVMEFDYLPDAESDAERFIPVLEASPDPACKDFQVKMERLSGSASDTAQIGSKGTSGNPEIGQNGNIRPGQNTQSKASKSRTKSSKRQEKLAKAKQSAIDLVRASSRDALMSKPPKLLRELVQDLGGSCRACLEKIELVDRLLSLAGVEHSGEL